MVHTLDATDRKIIALLQLDGRMSNVDIASEIGLTEGSVRKRIEHLLSDSVIRVTAVASLDNVGLVVETILMLRVDLGQVDRVGAKLAAMKEVRTVKYATGDYDIVAEAAFASDDDLLEFLTGRLASLPGVRTTTTSHILKTVKDSWEWALPRLGQPRVLVVDDDPDFVEFCRLVLEKAGYQVLAAANGDLGLRTMRQERPDLVILDVMMSGVLDGLHASRQMKAERVLGRTPILMVSSIAGSEHAGLFPTDEYIPVENFLSKPVDPDHLVSEIQRLLP